MTGYHLLAVAFLIIAIAMRRYAALIAAYHLLGAFFFTRAALAEREPRWMPLLVMFGAFAMFSIAEGY